MLVVVDIDNTMTDNLRQYFASIGRDELYEKCTQYDFFHDIGQELFDGYLKWIDDHPADALIDDAIAVIRKLRERGVVVLIATSRIKSRLAGWNAKMPEDLSAIKKDILVSILDMVWQQFYKSSLPFVDFYIDDHPDERISAHSDMVIKIDRPYNKNDEADIVVTTWKEIGDIIGESYSETYRSC